ncbi:MAG: mobile mystery protein A [Fidelibacterota bacterium]
MKERDLMRNQLDRKIIKFKNLKDLVIPPTGWVYPIRKALNISLRQLGTRMGITAQSVKEIETREKNASISIGVLRQVGKALNMKFVYGFIPQDDTLEKMLEKQAREVARKIVQRTSVTMDLEAQRTSNANIQSAIEEKTKELLSNIPRYLWDLN